MAAATVQLAGRVALVGGISALLPSLKGMSLTQPTLDMEACRDAMHAGATCQPCVSKFKLCKGHFVYEPFTVVLFEASLTIAVGILATALSDPRRARAQLLDGRALRRVAPIGATYALGDVMDLLAASQASPTTLMVAAQLRLPLCAVLRWVLLGRGQTLRQWAVLVLITLLCLAHVSSDLGSGSGGSVAAASPPSDVIMAMLLIFGKCVISCGGAVHAEYFLQHGDAKQTPLWVTQVHFKTATAVSCVVVGYLQGRRGGRIMATHWHGNLFVQLPPEVRVGDPRTPFFGGWNSSTWALVATLVSNNFIIGDQLRRLSSVGKYVAYALGLVLSYSVQLWTGSRQFEAAQAGICGAIALAALAYVSLPGPPPPKPEAKAA